MTGRPVSDGGTLRQLVMRWALAAAFVTAVHGGVALAIVHWPRPEPPASEPPAAVMIELAPLPVAPDSPPEDVAVGERQEVAQENTPVDAKTPPVKEAESPDAPHKEPKPEVVEREAETKMDVPELPQLDTAAAVLEAPAHKPESEEIEEKPDEKEKPAKKARPRPKSVARTTSAPKAIEVQRAKTNAAPTSGTASSMSVATWRGEVIAHLNRHKRYPDGGGSAGGTSSVAFTIDRAGHVLSARLIQSSGSAVLDQEAVALARRASPVPMPPPDIARATIVLTVPVRFSR